MTDGSTQAQRSLPLSTSYIPDGNPGPYGGGTYTGYPTEPTIRDYENVFGPSARDIKDDMQKYKRHGRWHLPDILKGPNPWLTDRIDGLITDATNSPFTSIILPYRYHDNVDGKIKWNVWSFDEGMASRVPYEAAARTLTQSKRSYAGYAVRHGLAINLEHNFMMTPQGRENFQNQLKQLIGSIQYSNDLDVHMALILAPSYEKIQREKYYGDGKPPAQICREFVDLFGFMQKNQNALDILIEESKIRLKTWGGPMPDFMLTNSKLGFQLQMVPERTNYLTQGPDGVKRLKQGPDISSYRGLKIIHTRAFSLETGLAPRDMLRRRVRVAEYYRIPPSAGNVNREFEFYNEARDNWFSLTFLDLLKMARLQARGDDDINDADGDGLPGNGNAARINRIINELSGRGAGVAGAPAGYGPPGVVHKQLQAGMGRQMQGRRGRGFLGPPRHPVVTRADIEKTWESLKDRLKHRWTESVSLNSAAFSKHTAARGLYQYAAGPELTTGECLVYVPHCKQGNIMPNYFDLGFNDFMTTVFISRRDVNNGIFIYPSLNVFQEFQNRMGLNAKELLDYQQNGSLKEMKRLFLRYAIPINDRIEVDKPLCINNFILQPLGAFFDPNNQNHISRLQTFGRRVAFLHGCWFFTKHEIDYLLEPIKTMDGSKAPRMTTDAMDWDELLQVVLEVYARESSKGSISYHISKYFKEKTLGSHYSATQDLSYWTLPSFDDQDGITLADISNPQCIYPLHKKMYLECRDDVFEKTLTHDFLEKSMAYYHKNKLEMDSEGRYPFFQDKNEIDMSEELDEHEKYAFKQCVYHRLVSDAYTLELDKQNIPQGRVPPEIFDVKPGDNANPVECFFRYHIPDLQKVNTVDWRHRGLQDLVAAGTLKDLRAVAAVTGVVPAPIPVPAGGGGGGGHGGRRWRWRRRLVWVRVRVRGSVRVMVR